jgi:transaldolase
MTLVFSAPQALLAARAGARYFSPFVGRFDDIGDDGLEQLETVVRGVKNYSYGYWDAGGRPRDHHRLRAHPQPRDQAALMGADIATVPFAALKKCLRHPLTDQGRERFDADWAKVTGEQA